MKGIRSGQAAALTGMMALAAAGCGDLLPWGGGGGGGGGGSIVVDGNIDGVQPVSSRDIVMFVYTTDEDADDCEKPEIPNDSSDRNLVLEDGEVEFEVQKVEEGRLVIAFLLDNAGEDADGEIDEGDPVAILDDPDCFLEEVGEDFTIHADDVQINFTDTTFADFAAPGRALAGSLTQTNENDD